MVCAITYLNYITTHTFPLGSEKGMSYYIFTMVCPNTEYVLLSILVHVPGKFYYSLCLINHVEQQQQQ